jgi:hypothetical protein
LARRNLCGMKRNRSVIMRIKKRVDYLI